MDLSHAMYGQELQIQMHNVCVCVCVRACAPRSGFVHKAVSLPCRVCSRRTRLAKVGCYL